MIFVAYSNAAFKVQVRLIAHSSFSSFSCFWILLICILSKVGEDSNTIKTKKKKIILVVRFRLHQFCILGIKFVNYTKF